MEITEHWAAHDLLIRQLGSDLRIEFQQQPPRKIYVESVVQVLANHLVRNYSTSRVASEDITAKLSPQKLQQAIGQSPHFVNDYIHERIDRDITLSELANVVMSQYRFARAFKQSIGMPPYQSICCNLSRTSGYLVRDNGICWNAN